MMPASNRAPCTDPGMHAGTPGISALFETPDSMLRGVGLGGWMNMENFITGYPANEESMRAALRAELGQERYELFFDRFLEYFFGDKDAEFLRSLNLNLVRLPINYRNFESDAEP